MTSPAPDTHPQNQASPRPEGFGALLRAAREARDLNRQDVADALRLSPRMVEAIELENLASLPPPLFIKGYLRSYATLVGLDETSLVRDFEAWVPTTDPLQMIPVRKRPTTDLSDVGRGRQLASAILLLVMLGGVMYWWLQPPAPMSDFALEESELVQDTATTSDPVPEGLVEVPAASLSETSTDEPVAMAENMLAAGEGAPTGTVPSSPPVSESPQAIASDPAPVVENVGNQPEMAGKPDEGLQAQRMATLKIRYLEDCWTEVRDARGRQLIYRLAKAGSEQEVSGDPPFSLYLGYAPGVAVEIDGQAVPITALVGNSTVARFKLERPQ